MTAPPSERRLHQAEGIVHATLALIFAQGVSALSMSAIAQAAGISRQTLYKYFADVESVLRAAVQSSPHDTADIVGAGTPVDQLTTYVRYVLDAVAAGHPSTSALEHVLAPDTRAELQAHAAQMHGVLSTILRRGKEDRSFRSDLDPDIDAEIVYRTVTAVAEMAAGNSQTVHSQIDRAILSMVGHGDRS